MKFLKIQDQIINVAAIVRINLNAIREMSGNDQALTQPLQEVVIELAGNRANSYPELIRYSGEIAEQLRAFFADLYSNNPDSEFVDLELWAKERS